MKQDQILGEVQHHARLASPSESEKALHAVLATLAERIAGDEADHLAAQLPGTLGNHVREHRGADRTAASFTLDQFYERVAKREDVDLPDAVHHSKVVLAVLSEAITPGQMEHICANLPEEFNELFESEAMKELQRS